MELYRQTGSKFWTADFVIDGRRIRRSTKQTTKARASEVASEFLRQAQNEETPAINDRGLRVVDFAESNFIPFIQASSLRPNTKRYYATGWRLLKNSDAVNWRLNQVTRSRADTLQFLGSGSNQNCALRTLRRMLALAEDQGILKAVPRIKLRKENERTAIFNPHTEAQFLLMAKQPMRDIFLLIQDSGMRPNEAIRIRWEDVLWDESLIFVSSGKTSKARRHVPLSDRVRASLRARGETANSKWVFASERSKSGHISYFYISKQFAARREEAGIAKDIVLYSARHTFATDMMAHTCDLTKVGKVLGHSTTRITERYVHPQLKELAEMVNDRNARRADEALRHSLCHR